VYFEEITKIVCPLIIITEILAYSVQWPLSYWHRSSTFQVYTFPIPIATLLHWAIISVFRVFTFVVRFYKGVIS